MTDLNSLRVMIARIEERQIADRERADERSEKAQEAADHRHRNVQQSLEGLTRKVDNFVPRDEIKEMMTERDTRIEKIESTHRTIRNASLAGTVFGGGVLYAIGKKMGIVS